MRLVAIVTACLASASVVSALALPAAPATGSGLVLQESWIDDFIQWPTRSVDGQLTKRDDGEATPTKQQKKEAKKEAKAMKKQQRKMFGSFIQLLWQNPDPRVYADEYAMLAARVPKFLPQWPPKTIKEANSFKTKFKLGRFLINLVRVKAMDGKVAHFPRLPTYMEVQLEDIKMDLHRVLHEEKLAKMTPERRAREDAVQALKLAERQKKEALMKASGEGYANIEAKKMDLQRARYEEKLAKMISEERAKEDADQALKMAERQKKEALMKATSEVYANIEAKKNDLKEAKQQLKKSSKGSS